MTNTWFLGMKISESTNRFKPGSRSLCQTTVTPHFNRMKIPKTKKLS